MLFPLLDFLSYVRLDSRRFLVLNLCSTIYMILFKLAWKTILVYWWFHNVGGPFLDFCVFLQLVFDLCTKLVHGMRYLYLVLNGGWVEARGDSARLLEGVWLRRKNESQEMLEKGAKSRTWRSAGRKPHRYRKPGHCLRREAPRCILARARGGSVQGVFWALFAPF